MLTTMNKSFVFIVQDVQLYSKFQAHDTTKSGSIRTANTNVIEEILLFEPRLCHVLALLVVQDNKSTYRNF